MRAIAGVAGALLLAGCSGGEPAGDPLAANGSGAATSGMSGGVSNGPDAAPATPTSAGMTAQVSALTGDVSGLNTRMSEMGLVIDLPSDALFAYDKAELTAAAERELSKAAELIRSSPPGLIKVIGHTDSKGDDAYNQTLSEARAKTVADWFGQQVGVRQRAFEVSGEGETAPIATNATANGRDDPAGRAKNRRVEVVVPVAAG